MTGTVITMAILALMYAAYRYGKRSRWLEPHCYCRNVRGHACLTECWEGKRQQHGWSKSWKWFSSLPRWRRWLHTYR